MTDTTANTYDEQSLTARISTEVVRTLKETFGKGHGDLVRQFRQTYQNEIGGVLIAKVEALTGRNVMTYQSQVLFHPSIVMEIFFFDDVAADGAGPAEVEIAP
jgi:hypothetical protein